MEESTTRDWIRKNVRIGDLILVHHERLSCTPSVVVYAGNYHDNMCCMCITIDNRLIYPTYNHVLKVVDSQDNFCKNCLVSMICRKSFQILQCYNIRSK